MKLLYMKKYMLLFLFLPLLLACEPQMGPCVHIYEDPILTIQTVTSEETGDAISPLIIDELKLDSNEIDIVFMMGGITKNLTFSDSLLICTVPCGFGTEEGTYEMTVSADGYNDSTVSTQAKYENSESGCPGSSSEGSQISFTLTPE